MATDVPTDGRRRLISASPSGGGGESKVSEEELGVVRICGLRTLPSHRQLGLAVVILASTAYFAMEMSTFTANPQTTLQRSSSSSSQSGSHHAVTTVGGDEGGGGVSLLGGGGMSEVLRAQEEAAQQEKEEEVLVVAASAGRSYDETGYPWTKVKGGKVTFLDGLIKAAEVIRSERDAIWNLHTPHSENIFPTLHFLSDTHLKARLSRAVLAQDTFTIGVMGTSVTAGHDNFFNQSYPVVWGRLMQKSFESAGVQLVMRNHAMGWNPIHPSYLCVGEVIGEDVDVGVWEYAMMGGDDGDAETWIRMALLLPNQPQVLFLDPGLGARDNAEGPREGTPGPWETNPMKWYAEAGFSVASQVMEHAFWKVDHLPQYNANSMIPKDKPTEKPAGWHPGPHGHELRAQILAWNYLKVLEDVIKEVHFTVSSDRDLDGVLPKAITMPPPHQCDTMLCKERPQCVTTFEPRVGPSLMTHVTSPPLDNITTVTDFGKAANNEQEGWHTQLYFCDTGSVGYMLDKGFNYLDRKIILQGNNHDGPVRLEYEQMSTTSQHLIVCSAPGNAHLCKSSRWKIDGVETKCLDEEAARAAGKPVVHEPCFISEGVYGPGKHTFEVEMLEPWQDHDNFIPLSHLIWY